MVLDVVYGSLCWYLEEINECGGGSLKWEPE
jgi:hypothetical protein